MKQLTQHINKIKAQNNIKPLSKKDLEVFLVQTLNLNKQRSVFTCDNHSFRVSQVRGNTKGFSNVVLGLSTLLKYDDKPFVVIVVRDNTLQFLISNTTFLKKISHSSHTLTTQNIKGSFLGHDIYSEYAGIKNTEKNFRTLFNIHQQNTLSENIERLVASTDKIKGKENIFTPNTQQRDLILLSPLRYSEIIKQADYIDLATNLQNKILYLKQQILDASFDENINTRGSTIEQIITDGISEHRAEDIIVLLRDGTKVLIDIKTKLSHLNSNPKAFNIDKALKTFSEPDEIFCFLMILIDRQESNIKSNLIPVLSTIFLQKLEIRHHWAGRNSRGVTQLSGDIYALFNSANSPTIDIKSATKYLQSLLDIKE